MREITPDKQKADALIKLAGKILERINKTNVEEFPSLVLKDYYDSIHELFEAICYIDGLKFEGDAAHIDLINYISKAYELGEINRKFLQELRDERNHISYEGLEINYDNLKKIKNKIEKIISLSKIILKSKLTKR